MELVKVNTNKTWIFLANYPFKFGQATFFYVLMVTFSEYVCVWIMYSLRMHNEFKNRSGCDSWHRPLSMRCHSPKIVEMTFIIMAENYFLCWLFISYKSNTSSPTGSMFRVSCALLLIWHYFTSTSLVKALTHSNQIENIGNNANMYKRPWQHKTATKMLFCDFIFYFCPFFFFLWSKLMLLPYMTELVFGLQCVQQNSGHIWYFQFCSGP